MPTPPSPSHTNQLIHSTSPYLLQHAHNPVDWHPWSPQALDLARSQNKPIFLSIGYSACHWCHVMEREVFENPDIASLMNQHFINIKVDREERPDLDDLYMLATQLMSGSGGWPMSVWLTPNLEPFYAGTYFPPTDGYGRPGFPRLTLALADAWKNRNAQLLEQAAKVVAAMKLHADESTPAAVDQLPLHSWLNLSLQQHADRFDSSHGGFGSAPKFPPHQALALFTHLLTSNLLAPASLDHIKHMSTATLDAMQAGGIFDHIAGGFARYSTDEHWLVPHFEKMLYDNAQLAPVYALAAKALGREDYARTARSTLDYWLREMTDCTTGAFHSTLDADSEGAEGKFYVWTVSEIRALLGNPDDTELLCSHLGISEHGNWHESPIPAGCVPSIVTPIETLAAQRNVEPSQMRNHIEGLLLKLREARHKRVPPGLDDKVLTAWSGLMLSALAIAGDALEEPRYLAAAKKSLDFLYASHFDGTGRLHRTSRHGNSHILAFLDDHAFLLLGILDLHAATGDAELLTRAARAFMV